MVHASTNSLQTPEYLVTGHSQYPNAALKIVYVAVLSNSTTINSVIYKDNVRKCIFLHIYIYTFIITVFIILVGAPSFVLVL